VAGSKRNKRKRSGHRRAPSGPGSGSAAGRTRTVRKQHDPEEEIFDPALPADVCAKALLDLEEGEAVPAGLASAIALQASVDRAREVARAVSLLAPESLTAVELSAQVAELEDDFASAAQMREEALARSDDPRLRLHLAHAYEELHRMADALELLERLTADDPVDDLTGALFSVALMEANHHLMEIGSRDRCPCGSGRRYGTCCRTKERRALKRFKDPSPLYDLRKAVNAYSDRPRFAGAIRTGLDEWVSEVDLADPASGERNIVFA
jgi:hypothetical protein